MGARGSNLKKEGEGDGGDNSVPPSSPNIGSNDHIIPSNDHRIVPLDVHQNNPNTNHPADTSLSSPNSIPILNSSSSAELRTLQPIQSNFVLTPRREDNLYTKISYTPIGPEQISLYKYYCPLCMSFYKDILVSSTCCQNYICSECIVDYLTKRNHQVNQLNDVLVGAPYKTLACPHCNTTGFTPALVSPIDGIRNYHDSTSPTQNLYSSPMKIGDTFEDMKRKMASLSQRGGGGGGSSGGSAERGESTTSSKPLLPPSGNKGRQFSPDVDISRCIEPLPFPSLDGSSSLAPSETNSNPPSHRSQTLEGVVPDNPLSSTPLRGIALFNSAKSYEPSPAESSEINQTSMHEIASDFVYHLMKHNSNHSNEGIASRRDSRRGSKDFSNDSQNLSWVSSLFQSPAVTMMKRGSSKSKVTPLNVDEDDQTRESHSTSLTAQNRPQMNQSSTPRFVTPSPRTEREVHQFATLFVNTILPQQ